MSAITNDKPTVEASVTMNLASGDYEISFHNMSNPGEPMDYGHIKVALQRVLADFTAKTEGANTIASAPVNLQ